MRIDKKCSMIVLCLAIQLAWSSNEPWKDYRKIQGGEISFLNIDLVLSSLDYKIESPGEWEGDTQDGYANGMGKLHFDVVLSEVDGFRKFYRRLTIQGPMKRGSFVGEIVVTMEKPDRFQEKLLVVYTDGDLIFPSKAEWEKFSAKVAEVARTIAPDLKRVQNVTTIDDKVEKVVEVLTDKEKKPDLPKESRSLVKSLKDIFRNYQKMQGGIDPVLKKGMRMIGAAILPRVLKSILPHGDELYMLYVILTQSFDV